MRATWRRGRLFAMVPASGGEIRGVAVTRAFDLPLPEAHIAATAAAAFAPDNAAVASGLFVNAMTVRNGTLRVGVLAAQSSAGSRGDGVSFVPGFAPGDCVAFQGDGVRVQLAWKGGKVLPQTGSVQLQFELLRARLWSFWFERVDV